MEKDFTEILDVGGDECTVILRRIEDDLNFGLSLAANGDAEVTIGLALAADVTSAMEHFVSLAAIANDDANTGNAACDDSFYAQLTFGGQTDQVSWSLTLQRDHSLFELVLITSELGDDRRIGVRLDGESIGQIIASAKKLVVAQP